MKSAIKRYRAYRSYGHGQFVSISHATPDWLIILIGCAIGGVLIWTIQ